MKVHVLYFASCREAVGRQEETVELEDGASLRDLLNLLVRNHPELAGLEPTLALSINQDYADRDQALKEGDEVALIPPVSGGQGAPRGTYAVVERPISLEEVERLVRLDSCGAIAAFAGVVRARSRGRRVLYLYYEAYRPMAERYLAQIGQEIGQKWPVEAVAIIHRVGRIEVGQMSLAIGVASPHRKEALEACAYALERVKEIVPIWKKEVFEEGEEWVGPGQAH